MACTPTARTELGGGGPRVAGPTAVEFIYLPLERVIYGPGSVARLGEELERLGARRALVVTGNSIATGTDLLDRVRASLGGRLAGIFGEAREHNPREAVVEGAALARQAGADALVSLGGGSAIDCAKGIAVVLAEGKGWEECRIVFEFPDRLRIPTLTRPKLPHLAIPTTLSGAEFTHVTGILRREVSTKEGFLDPRLAPRVVFLDPEVTLATPPRLWASTGLKALDHCVESVYSVRQSHFRVALCLEAVRLVFDNLEASLARPADLGVRLRLQEAAWLAGYAMTNSWAGISHALGHQLGSRCGVPHGMTSGILLPRAMAFNRPVTLERQALLAEAMGGARPGMSAEEAAVAAADAVADLVRRLGLPQRLRDVGVPEAALEAVAAGTAGDFFVSLNPRPIRGKDEILGLLREAW